MPNQYHNLGWLLITLSNYDLITIKHSIPGRAAPIGGNPQLSKSPTQHNTTQIDKSYPLCKGRDYSTLRRSLVGFPAFTFYHDVLL